MVEMKIVIGSDKPPEPVYWILTDVSDEELTFHLTRVNHDPVILDIIRKELERRNTN